MSRLLLCSTDDEKTVDTWKHLGFQVTNTEELESWGICSGDLLHMTNTIQMVKVLGEPKSWKALLIRHEHFVQRTYYCNDAQGQRGQKRRRSSPHVVCEQGDYSQINYCTEQNNIDQDDSVDYKAMGNGVNSELPGAENIQEIQPCTGDYYRKDSLIPPKEDPIGNDYCKLEYACEEQGYHCLEEQATEFEMPCSVGNVHSNVGCFNQKRCKEVPQLTIQPPEAIAMVSLCSEIKYCGAGHITEEVVSEQGCFTANSH